MAVSMCIFRMTNRKNSFSIYCYFRQHMKKQIYLNVKRCMSSIQATTVEKSEYTPVPEYPKLVDPSKAAQKLREREVWYKQIEKMPTVDEKLYEISRQKRHWVYMVPTTSMAYGCQPYQLHVTRTHLVNSLPQEYNKMNVDAWVEKIRQPLLDCILIELEHHERLYNNDGKDMFREKIQSEMIIKNMISIIMSSGVAEYEHLLTSHVQDKPRLDYYWWNGRFYSRFTYPKYRTMYDTTCFQVNWQPACQILIEKPNLKYLDRDDTLCATADVPEYPYHPSHWRSKMEFRYLTCVPGYWLGSKNEHPLITFETRAGLKHYSMKNNNDTSYVEKIVDGMGIVGMFASLGAVASYHGFTQFHELTYPITSQLVVTDGRTWTFLVYQLNTICLHPDVDRASHRNICWSSGPMELYEVAENGQLKGVNDDILRLLLKFFSREPGLEQGIELKPFLGEDKRELSEIQTCRAELRKLFDNRMDHKLIRAETPTWHWVYKKNPLAPISPMIKLW